MLALGRKPVATTEWYGKQPYAVWPWATEALGDAKPTVLSTSDGFEFEKVASLQPDLIIGTNSGMKASDYKKFSELAPTLYFVTPLSLLYVAGHLPAALKDADAGNSPKELTGAA